MTNAIQFIKEQGVEKAREVVSGAPEGATHLSDDACHYVNADFKPLPDHIKEQLPELIDLSELKRLVESVDLLKSNGGYEEAKDTFDFAIKHGMNDLTEFGSRLKQAISDYKSIYSNDCEILDYPKDYTSPNCKKYDERVK